MNTYNKKYIVILFALILTVQCKSDVRYDTRLNLGELPVIEYQTTPLIEEDEHYIPAMFSKIFQLADNSWVISDHGSTTIEHFSAAGEHIATVAFPGEGPGEVRPYFFFHQFSDSIVVARQQMSNRLDYYKLNRQGELRHTHTNVMEQGSFIWTDLLSKSPDELMAIKRNGDFSDTQNYDEDLEYISRSVMILDFDLNVIRDSVTTLNLPNPWTFMSPQGWASVYPIPFRSKDQILPLNNGSYWVARGSDERFELYNHEHHLMESFDLLIVPRPVKREDIERRTSRIRDDLRDNIVSRIPETMPLFFDAWADANHLLLQTGETDDAREFVLVEHSGNMIGRFELPNSKHVQLINAGNLVVFNYDPDKGFSVDVISLTLNQDSPY